MPGVVNSNTEGFQEVVADYTLQFHARCLTESAQVRDGHLEPLEPGLSNRQRVNTRYGYLNRAARTHSYWRSTAFDPEVLRKFCRKDGELGPCIQGEIVRPSAIGECGHQDYRLAGPPVLKLTSVGITLCIVFAQASYFNPSVAETNGFGMA